METTVHSQTLRPGEMLNWYRITKVLGRGGFGITYLAFDSNLRMDVAIKEYLPEIIARRGSDNSVNPSTNEDDSTFKWGLSSFLKEARTLVKFKHPNIVRVLTVFESNGTAYMVMEFESGQDLKQLLSQHTTLDERYLKNLIVPIIDGLAEVHQRGFIHRDIKPANIYIRKDNTPVLLDFGSARLALTDATQNLTALVSVGFTPLEQYGNLSEQQQGPWTDIYALAAVLYYAIVGQPPVDATLRAAAILNDRPDPLLPAGKMGQDHYSANFLYAIDWGLGFKVSQRPQSLDAWRANLLSDDRTRLQAPVTVDRSKINTNRPTGSTGTILQPRSQRVGYSTTAESKASDIAETSINLDQQFSELDWETDPPIQQLAQNSKRKRTLAPIVLSILTLSAVVAGSIGYWKLQQPTQTALDTAQVQDEANANQTSDLNTNEIEASKQTEIITQKARDAEAAKQAEIAAQKARDAEAARQSEINAQKARDAEVAEQAEIAAQKARDAEAAKQAEIAAQKARDAEAAKQAEINAQKARDAEVAEQAEIAAQKARDAEAAKQAEIAAQKARDAEAAKQAEINAQKARDSEAAKQAEINAQKARDAEAAKQAEINAQKARDSEAAKQAEINAQKARDAEAAKQAEINAQKARDAEAAKQAEIAAQKVRDAEVSRQAEIEAENKRKAESQDKISAKPITNKDIQTAAARFNELMQSIQSRDLKQIKNLTSSSDRYDALFQYWFDNFERIEIQLDDISANRSQEQVNAQLTILRLLSSNGDIVLPAKSFRSIPIFTNRIGGAWSKIQWAD